MTSNWLNGSVVLHLLYFRYKSMNEDYVTRTEARAAELSSTLTAKVENFEMV